jgi:hypothetical protein
MDRTKVMVNWSDGINEEYYTDWQEVGVLRVNKLGILSEKLPEFPLHGLWWSALTDNQLDDLTEKTINASRKSAGLPPIESTLRSTTKKRLVKRKNSKTENSYKRIVTMLNLTPEEKIAWLHNLEE